MADLTGKKLGSYDIREQLGQGGMATVYKAYQPSMDRFVALKILINNDDPHFIERFRREARAVGSLRHPHILQVFDFGTQDNIYYMVMEFIRGGNLKHYIQQKHGLPLHKALDITRQLADALDYAHNAGMIHRDMKPANVMFIDQTHEQVVLTDFGIARLVGQTGLTDTGAFIGTPAYISPEVAKGMDTDERADLYGLGIILYEMITGMVPYQADTPIATIMKHVNAPLPTRADYGELPEAVEKIILRAMMKDPSERFQSARDMKQALESALYTLQDAELASSFAQYDHNNTSTNRYEARTDLEEPATTQGNLPKIEEPTKYMPVTQNIPRQGLPWMRIVGLLLVAVLAVIGAFAVMSGGDEDDPQVAEASVTPSATHTQPASPTDIPPTETTTPSATPIPPTPIPPTEVAVVQQIGGELNETFDRGFSSGWRVQAVPGASEWTADPQGFVRGVTQPDAGLSAFYPSQAWQNFELVTRIRFNAEDTAAEIAFKGSEEGAYYLSFGGGILSFSSSKLPAGQTYTSGFYNFADHIGEWLTLDMRLLGETLVVNVNSTLVIDYTIPNPDLAIQAPGTININILRGSVDLDEWHVREVDFAPPVTEVGGDFVETFDQGFADGWRLENVPGISEWTVQPEGFVRAVVNNDVLAAEYRQRAWRDFALSARVRWNTPESTIEIGFTNSREGGYFLGFGGEFYAFSTNLLPDDQPFTTGNYDFARYTGEWVTLHLQLVGDTMRFRINDDPVLAYTINIDAFILEEPGTITFNIFQGSSIDFDNLEIREWTAALAGTELGMAATPTENLASDAPPPEPTEVPLTAETLDETNDDTSSSEVASASEVSVRVLGLDVDIYAAPDTDTEPFMTIRNGRYPITARTPDTAFLQIIVDDQALWIENDLSAIRIVGDVDTLPVIEAEPAPPSAQVQGIILRLYPEPNPNFDPFEVGRGRHPIIGRSDDNRFLQIDYDGQVGWIQYDAEQHEILGDLDTIPVRSVGVQVRLLGTTLDGYPEPRMDIDPVMVVEEGRYPAYARTTDNTLLQIQVGDELIWISNEFSMRIGIFGDVDSLPVIDEAPAPETEPATESAVFVRIIGLDVELFAQPSTDFRPIATTSEGSYTVVRRTRDNAFLLIDYNGQLAWIGNDPAKLRIIGDVDAVPIVGEEPSGDAGASIAVLPIVNEARLFLTDAFLTAWELEIDDASDGILPLNDLPAGIEQATRMVGANEITLGYYDATWQNFDARVGFSPLAFGDGGFEFKFRVQEYDAAYAVGVNAFGVYVSYLGAEDDIELAFADVEIPLETWHQLHVVLIGDTLTVALDDQPIIPDLQIPAELLIPQHGYIQLTAYNGTTMDVEFVELVELPIVTLNFDDGEWAAGWEVGTSFGEWQPTDGFLRANRVSGVSATYIETPFMNFEAEFDMRFAEGNTGGWEFKFRIDDDRNYTVGFHADAVYIKAQGMPDEALVDAPYAYGTDWIHVAIIVNGQGVIVVLNGEPILTQVFDSPNNRIEEPGLISLQTYSEVQFDLDNLVIRGLGG